MHNNQEHSGRIKLSAGFHAIRVEYFEKSGNEILAVKYEGPGISKQRIPDNKLFISEGAGANAKTSTENAKSKGIANAPTSKDVPVPGKTEILSVHPNPVADKIHIRFTSDNVGKISGKLLDYTGAGHKINFQNVPVINGEVVIDVTQWGLSAGIYLLQISYNEGKAQEVFRIIKK